MIYDDLKVLLQSLTDEHEIQVFDNVVATLEKYEATNYMDVFNAALGDVNVDNTTEVMDTLRGSLRTILAFMLNLHGVVLKDECLLSEHQVVLDAFFEAGESEEKEQITQLLQAEGSPIELAASLVARQSTYSIENVMTWIETVEPVFGQRFLEGLQEQETQEPEDYTEVKAQVELYARYRQMLGNPELFSDLFFAERGSLGLPLERYLQLYSHRVELDVVPLADVAKVCYGCALISQDGHGNPLGALAKFVPQLYTELRSQTAMTVELGKIDQRFSGVRNG